MNTLGNDPVPTVYEAGWAPWLVWMFIENSPLPGFDPWTIQPVVSRYPEYAILAMI